jgi:hypothetical protein
MAIGQAIGQETGWEIDLGRIGWEIRTVIRTEIRWEYRLAQVGKLGWERVWGIETGIVGVLCHKSQMTRC